MLFFRGLVSTLVLGIVHVPAASRPADFDLSLLEFEKPCDVPRISIHGLSRQEFTKQFIIKSEPAIITDIPQIQRVMEKWSDEELIRRIGYEIVAVSVTKDRSSRTASFSINSPKPSKLKMMRFAEFLTTVRDPKRTKDLYLQSAVFQNLSKDLPHLSIMRSEFVGSQVSFCVYFVMRDLALVSLIQPLQCETYDPVSGEEIVGEEGVPTWCGRLWMSHSDPICNTTDGSCRGLVHSHLHTDKDINFHVIVAGRKRFNLVHPDFTSRLEVDPRFHRSSYVDLRVNPVPHRGCTVNAGEVMFIPTNWWHEVITAPGRNMGLNWWQRHAETIGDMGKRCRSWKTCDTCIAAGCAFCQDSSVCVPDDFSACSNPSYHVALDRHPFIRALCGNEAAAGELKYLQQLRKKLDNGFIPGLPDTTKEHKKKKKGTRKSKADKKAKMNAATKEDL